jgi:hypothetical protein
VALRHARVPARRNFFGLRILGAILVENHSDRPAPLPVLFLQEPVGGVEEEPEALPGVDFIKLYRP